MITLGIIGTNWITDKFIEAAQETGLFKLTAVYSRTNKRAKEFALKYDVTDVFTDLETFFKSATFNAVYIASPNACHKKQAIQAMQHGKHVLVEKPMAANVSEVKEMQEIAKEEGVILAEAMKTTHLPHFKVLRTLIDEIKPIRRVVANFCQYSSRYDQYKAGTILNAFDPTLANGALMDIGVYTVYPLVRLFGKPLSVRAHALMLESGVDGSGTILLDYGTFHANLHFSKITDSVLSSEIQGENGSVLIEKWSNMSGVVLIDKFGKRRDLSRLSKTFENDMIHEALDFGELIISGQKESGTNRYKDSLQTMEILDEVRRQIGLVFPADR